MAQPRHLLHATLVTACYLLWTGVLIGLGGSAGLWLIGRVIGDGSDTSSAYEVVSDNAQWLLVGSGVLAVVAAALSWWVDRYGE